MEFKKAFGLHMRGVKLLHKHCPKLFPLMALQKLIQAVTPYITLYFTAQLLDEIAGARREAVLLKLAILLVSVSGILAGLSMLFTRLEGREEHWFSFEYSSILPKKMLTMDFVDVESIKKRDQLVQIEQNANWGGWGWNYVVQLFPVLVENVVGILGAAVLLIPLFTSRVKKGSFLILNNPLCVVVILGSMVLLSIFSGKLEGLGESVYAKNAIKGRMGNRIFAHFGLMGCDTARADTGDMRLYPLEKMGEYYQRAYMMESWGAHGFFAKLGKGRVGVCNFFAAGIATLFTGIIYVFTCLKALGGAFGIGGITQYVGAATQLSGNIKALFVMMEDMKNNGEFLAEIFDFLDTPNNMYQGSLTTEKRADRNYNVEFKDVSFKYPGTDTWALRHVNVSFEIGKRLAVVGENGSGKTTFIKLLCRLYDPQEGQILLNGIDIKKYNYREYMDLFSVVFQDFQLLSQPLGDNVACSKEYDEARVKQVLQDAGYEAPLDQMLYREYGEEGVDVSGGEAQKIAIARALYQDSPFLILDEPTAALDPIAEAEIYSQLDSIVKDRTAVYISHRLSSCRFCDEIMVFDHGEIVERGEHDALLKKCGKYQTLWNAQAQYYV